jgi:dihydroorotase
VDYVRSAGRSGRDDHHHHLIINRNHILAGGIRPHYYCLPVAKRETHRWRCVAAATSGDPRFFLGTDSAPHADAPRKAPAAARAASPRRTRCRCLAHVFEEEGALDRLEGFASLHGPAFYRLPPNEDRITLERGDGPVAYPARSRPAPAPSPSSTPASRCTGA